MLQAPWISSLPLAPRPVSASRWGLVLLFRGRLIVVAQGPEAERLNLKYDPSDALLWY